ncbi:hypothetical protein G6F56_000198 [Rhizopus delemar]|uniref:Uncharacterized protein n=1 Tax=Rhizopus stolonifer TaxID=4846 RepID=A0A367KU01_RHIST|nr:hypothetical protein G6F56_000198 [Rhizopus delemar]RCI05666.1 hypothetical protein CU098_011324 [Rhizopus stolonifer]
MIFHQGDNVQFVANEVSHDDDTTIRVSLYASGDDSLVKNLGDFNGKEVSSSGDDFWFSWLPDVPDGQYYVTVAELEEEDEDGDEDNGEDDEDDDTNRSYDFQIVTYQDNRDQSNQYQPNTYQFNQYQPTQYQPNQYQPTQYQPNQYQPTQYQPNQYQPNQYQPNSYPTSPQPYPSSAYSGHPRKRQAE